MRLTVGKGSQKQEILASRERCAFEKIQRFKCLGATIAENNDWNTGTENRNNAEYSYNALHIEIEVFLRTNKSTRLRTAIV